VGLQNWYAAPAVYHAHANVSHSVMSDPLCRLCLLSSPTFAMWVSCLQGDPQLLEGFETLLWVKNPPAMQKMQKIWVQFLVHKDPLEKGMATHSSILAWRIPWTEEPGGLQSMESQRVGHD